MSTRLQKRRSNQITWSINKIYTRQTLNQHSWNHPPIFHLLPTFEKITCNTRQVIASWIQAVSFLQMPRSNLRPAASTAAARLGRKGLIPVNHKGLHQGCQFKVTQCWKCWDQKPTWHYVTGTLTRQIALTLCNYHDWDSWNCNKRRRNERTVHYAEKKGLSEPLMSSLKTASKMLTAWTWCLWWEVKTQPPALVIIGINRESMKKHHIVLVTRVWWQRSYNKMCECIKYMHNRYSRCINESMPMKNKSVFFSLMPVTLKIVQDHQSWYKCIKSDRGYQHISILKLGQRYLT